jgi:predicted MFS family arabinose efflux permease
VLLLAGGWRAIFFVNLPLVAAALAIAWQALPRRSGAAPETAFDWVGAAMLATVLGGAALLVVEGRHAPAVLVAGVPLLIVLGVVFVRRELRHADPVLQPRFFSVRPFAAANAGIASSNLAFYTALLAIPILLSRHLEWTSFQTGIALALLSAPMVVCSPIGGRLADRLGRRPPSTAGCAILAAGLLPLAVMPDLGPYLLLPCLCLMGAGVGLSTAGLQASAVEALDPEQAGVAAGIYSTSRYIGSFIGSIVLARLLDEGEGLSGFPAVFLMAFAAACLSILATLALPGRSAPVAAEPAPASVSSSP